MVFKLSDALFRAWINSSEVMPIQKITNMATFTCRVQYLDDTDPFSSTNFPEPTRPPTFTFHINVPLVNQIGGVHRLLQAPHKVSDFGSEIWNIFSCQCKQYVVGYGFQR